MGQGEDRTNMDAPGMNLYIFQMKMPRIGFQSRMGGRSWTPSRIITGSRENMFERAQGSPWPREA